MRFIALHYHLFKNAGSTVDSILSSNFPDDLHGHIEGAYPWSTLGDREVLEYAIANPHLRAISSHQARLPLPIHPDITFLPILFLRHPIDRFASVYEFERLQPTSDLSPSAAIARNGGLAAFADWVAERDSTAVCRNFQVAHLAGVQRDMREARATHEDYKRALRQLEGLPFFGLVESFEESLTGLQELMHPLIGDLDLEFTIQNSTAGRPERLEERLAHIENELGPARYRELLERNALDMLLYDEAQRIFAAARAKRENDKSPVQPLTIRQRMLRALSARHT